MTLVYDAEKTGKHPLDLQGQDGAPWVYLKSLLAGEFPQFNRLGAGMILPYTAVLASATVKSTPAIYGGVFCLTAGTLSVYDNTTAAGTAFINARAMAAGEFCFLGAAAASNAVPGVGIITSIGLHVAVTTGTYLVLAA